MRFKGIYLQYISLMDHESNYRRYLSDNEWNSPSFNIFKIKKKKNIIRFLLEKSPIKTIFLSFEYFVSFLFSFILSQCNNYFFSNIPRTFFHLTKWRHHNLIQNPYLNPFPIFLLIWVSPIIQFTKNIVVI